MDKLVLWIKRSWLAIIISAVLANGAFAITAPASIPGTFENLGSTIGTIFNVVILIAAVAFVILFLIGGIQYLTAAGNEENSQKAKKLLIDAVIGLIIVLAAWAIGTWILNQFDVSISEVEGQ